MNKQIKVVIPNPVMLNLEVILNIPINNKLLGKLNTQAVNSTAT